MICVPLFLPLRTQDSFSSHRAGGWVPEAGGAHLGELVQATLIGHDMLLLLDNFEQVLAAAPVVADLLRTCPRAHDFGDQPGAVACVPRA